ncbi:MAG: flagellar assembly protein FliW [Proteobacteria bacterium]|nr:flagellar assembly protein FliW [Pseudomonadota bacterium]
MKIDTDRFGQIEIDENNILHLPNGIIGFPECTRVILFDHERENSPFRWLQALDHPDLAFVVIDPLELVPDYPLDRLRTYLPDNGRNSTDIAVAAITTVPPAPASVTVNLVAPIIFDANTRIGVQVVLSDDRFRTRHILVRDEKKEQDKSMSNSL